MSAPKDQAVYDYSTSFHRRVLTYISQSMSTKSDARQESAKRARPDDDDDAEPRTTPSSSFELVVAPSPAKKPKTTETYPKKAKVPWNTDGADVVLEVLDDLEDLESKVLIQCHSDVLSYLDFFVPQLKGGSCSGMGSGAAVTESSSSSPVQTIQVLYDFSCDHWHQLLAVLYGVHVSRQRVLDDLTSEELSKWVKTRVLARLCVMEKKVSYVGHRAQFDHPCVEMFLYLTATSLLDAVLDFDYFIPEDVRSNASIVLLLTQPDLMPSKILQMIVIGRMIFTKGRMLERQFDLVLLDQIIRALDTLRFFPASSIDHASDGVALENTKLLAWITEENPRTTALLRVLVILVATTETKPKDFWRELYSRLQQKMPSSLVRLPTQQCSATYLMRALALFSPAPHELTEAIIPVDFSAQPALLRYRLSFRCPVNVTALIPYAAEPPPAVLTWDVPDVPCPLPLCHIDGNMDYFPEQYNDSAWWTKYAHVTRRHEKRVVDHIYEVRTDAWMMRADSSAFVDVQEAIAKWNSAAIQKLLV